MIDKLWLLLKQPSTKKGIIGLAAMAGIAISPEHWEAIASGAAIAYSVYQILRNEDKQIVDAKK